jgi:carboxylesterase type B
MLLQVVLIAISITHINTHQSSKSDETIIHLSYGQIRGRYYRTPNGNEGLLYLGVPYVHPPVGELRFQPPKPFTSDDKTVNISNYNRCFDAFIYSQPGQES